MADKDDKFGMKAMAALAESIKDSGILGVTPSDDPDAADQVDVDLLAVVEETHPIIVIAKTCLQKTVSEGAEEAHINSEKNGVSLSLRIAGQLHEVMRLPKYVHAPLVSRFKIMSGMNIAERTIPQSGKIHIRHAGKDYDFYVSVMPTTHRERVVLRLVRRDQIVMSLDHLRMPVGISSRLIELARSRRGLALVSGPADNMAASTMYSILAELIREQRLSAVSVEDPVVTDLPGAAQIAIDREVGLTHAVALRHLSQQSPDVVMVDQITNIETAESALGLAYSAFVIGGVPAINAEGALRLLSSYFSDSILLSSLAGVLCQRLVRLSCPDCKKQYQPDPKLLVALGFDFGPDAAFIRSEGCENCRFTGIAGRMPVYEFVEATPRILGAVVSKARIGQAVAKELGDATIRKQIIGMITDGSISVEEAIASLR